MQEIFGATLSLRDNVSAVLRQAGRQSRTFGSEVERARQRLRSFDRQK